MSVNYRIDRNFLRTYWVVMRCTWDSDRAIAYFENFQHAEAFKKILEIKEKAEHDAELQKYYDTFKEV